MNDKETLRQVIEWAEAQSRNCYGHAEEPGDPYHAQWWDGAGWSFQNVVTFCKGLMPIEAIPASRSTTPVVPDKPFPVAICMECAPSIPFEYEYEYHRHRLTEHGEPFPQRTTEEDGLTYHRLAMDTYHGPA